MRVLGIDPSLQSTGFGIVESDGDRTIPIAYGVIKPTARLPFFKKLHEIRGEIETLIRAYAPLGLEALLTDAGWFEGGWPAGAGNGGRGDRVRAAAGRAAERGGAG